MAKIRVRLDVEQTRQALEAFAQAEKLSKLLAALAEMVAKDSDWPGAWKDKIGWKDQSVLAVIAGSTLKTHAAKMLEGAAVNCEVEAEAVEVIKNSSPQTPSPEELAAQDLLIEIAAAAEADGTCVWDTKRVRQVASRCDYAEMWDLLTDLKDWAQHEMGTDNTAPDWWKDKGFTARVDALPIPGSPS